LDEFSTNGTLKKCIQNTVRKHEGKRTLGRPEHRMEDNIKINLKEIGCWA
jgi:hypothetical protein